jgi:hypothetical protein
MCRQLTTAVVDEEAEYVVLNKQLQIQLDHYKNGLTGLNEKLTVFNDFKNEMAETKERLQESETARVDLQSQLTSLTISTSALVTKTVQ